MGKRGKNKPRPAAREKKDLQAIYTKVRREFSASDLQKYTVIEEGVPAEQVLAAMEEIHRKETKKKV